MSYVRPAILLKKETLAQVFSCEVCEISKDKFFYRTPMVAASVCWYFHISINGILRRGSYDSGKRNISK